MKREKIKRAVLDVFKERQKEMLLADEVVELLLGSGFGNVRTDDPEEKRDALEREIIAASKELISDGKLLVTKAGRMGLPRAFGYTYGRLIVNEKGFGFFRPHMAEERKKSGRKSKGRDDVFVHTSKMLGALNNDEVLVTFRRTSRGKEACVEKIVRRAKDEFVGVFDQMRLRPDDMRLYRPIKITNNDAGAVNGEKVVVKVTNWGTDGEIKTKVKEILGKVGDRGIDILSVAKEFGLEAEFPPEVMDEVAELSDEISLAGRKDYRSLPTVTIDGADAKDLDDAISLVRVSDGAAYYRLYVHIADVSHYVRPGTALGDEAFDRATSVYLLDRVIPMLPKRLSNDLCSLNKGQDRYALSACIDFSKDGKVLGHSIDKSVINVDARLVYEGVSRFLEGENEEAEGKKIDPDWVTRCEPFAQMLSDMAELSKHIREERMARGAVDFDFPEPKIELGEDGVPTGIGRRERDVASMIIEDFMIAANEVVAEQFYWLEKPFVYRVHEPPSPEKIEELRLYASYFGVNLKGKGENVAIAKLIDDIKGSRYEAAIARKALRSMMQAKYSARNLGHFGLQSRFYCHFTAPIRRYPDLFIHRVISDYLASINGFGDRVDPMEIDIDSCEEAAEQSTEMEQNAENAERRVTAMKMAEYMEQHLGEVFDGTISTVTNYGLFIELDNLVEGLLHISLMPRDDYEFNEDRLTLIGRRTREVYAVGDEIEVLVAAADGSTGRVDFALVRDYKSRMAERDAERPGRNQRGRGRNAAGRPDGGKFESGRSGGRSAGHSVGYGGGHSGGHSGSRGSDVSAEERDKNRFYGGRVESYKSRVKTGKGSKKKRAKATSRPVKRNKKGRGRRK